MGDGRVGGPEIWAASGLCCLDRLERHEFCAEDLVPEPAGDAEAVFVICEMVLEVVFLELAVV
jgi:uncharacterized protein (DUF983 family)